LSDERTAVIEYLRSTLIGPKGGIDEIISADSPAYFYTAGILFPRGEDTERTLLDDDPDVGSSGTVESDDAFPEDPVSLANQQLPASAGLSFFLANSSKFVCEVKAAQYLSQGKDNWKRSELPEASEWESVQVEGTTYVTPIPVLGNRAYLHVVNRSVTGGFIVTVTLVNAAKESGKPGRLMHLPEKCLFQVGLRIKPGSEAQIEKYPHQFRALADEEEAELELLYRHRATYAIGHGCSTSWDTESESPAWVRIDFMPAVDVPPVQGHSGNHPALRLDYLSDPDAENLAERFSEFLEPYNSWIADFQKTLNEIQPGLQPAARRVIQRLLDTASRMDTGAKLICADPEVRSAFAIANRAMMLQMHHGKDELGGTPHSVDEDVPLPGSINDIDRGSTWYPFQLAFLLLVIPSLSDLENPDRELVDLIWFPTGGGKTEAYLAASAFEITLRRMRNAQNGGGTSVISRYTLRLLTAQQFQRTAGLACALELLRRSGVEELSGDSITVGLWVGDGETPNSLKKAQEFGVEIRIDRRPNNRFGLDRCPWCGTTIVPNARSARESDYGFTALDQEFRLRCPRPTCPFSDVLPVQVVDEMLYREPPTILMGTVDKFARLAWISDPGIFFGSDQMLPPGLIIQDEMHLLSGPLGTMFGMYEAGIDTVIRLRGGNPKIIASTATIRDAPGQTAGLFGRDVSIFPPPGMDESDSYFSRSDSDSDGRTYIGIMSPHRTTVTSLIRTVASLGQAPVELGLTGEPRDAYWTQVVFHNSLRELGNFLTQARDDVPAWIRVIAKDQSFLRSIEYEDVLEVSSNLGSSSAQALERMDRRYGQDGVVSIVACSNMFSVGVDVQRLGLMLVNGQPRSTSEYIQATSRVGRGDVPGLIVTHFSSTKPRDRSHYESFTSYHRSLYRYVEPASVTPMSLPARQRALHAALIIALRHGAGFNPNVDAGNVDFDEPEAAQALEQLIKRCESIGSAASTEVAGHLHRIRAEWERLREMGKSEFRPLYYDPSRTEHAGLLRDFGRSGDGWETPHSLRNVDDKVWMDVRN